MKLITAPSKTQQVTDIIRRRINSGQLKPGDRLEPIRVLAEKFSISRQVILSAFDRLASEGLLIKTVGRGTFINPAINEDSNNLKIGFFVQDSEISSHYNSSVFIGILEKANECGVGVSWGTNRNDRNAIDWLAEKNPDGLLLTGRVTDSLIKKIKATGIPFIVLGNYKLNENVNVIEANESGCLKQIFAGIVRKHSIKSAGAILGPKDLYISNLYAQEIQNAIEANGGATRDDWIIFSDQEKGYAEFKLLMNLDKQPDAVFITGNAFPGAAKYIFEHNLSERQRPLIITSVREKAAVLYPELINAATYNMGTDFGHCGIKTIVDMIKNKNTAEPVKIQLNTKFEILK